MTKDEYEAYRQTSHWRILSRHIRQSHNKCEKCAFPYELDVHHKTYERLGHEKLSDLEVLCRSCHMRDHFLDDLSEVPNIYFFCNVEETRERLSNQQKAAKQKNLDREWEIQKNKEREE